MAVVDAGELKRYVSVKQPTTTRNAEGSKEVTYADWIIVKAKITRNSQYRALEANATVLLNTDTVWFRLDEQRKGITKDHLLYFDGIDHTIQEIEYIGTERNRFIRFLVKGK